MRIPSHDRPRLAYHGVDKSFSRQGACLNPSAYPRNMSDGLFIVVKAIRLFTFLSIQSSIWVNPVQINEIVNKTLILGSSVGNVESFLKPFSNSRVKCNPSRLASRHDAFTKRLSPKAEDEDVSSGQREILRHDTHIQ